MKKEEFYYLVSPRGRFKVELIYNGPNGEVESMGFFRFAGDADIAAEKDMAIRHGIFIEHPKPNIPPPHPARKNFDKEERL